MVKSTLLNHVYASQVCFWIAQSSTANKSFYLVMRKGRIGLVDDKAHALFKAHPHNESVVLGSDGFQNGCGTHIAQFAFGFHI